MLHRALYRNVFTRVPKSRRLVVAAVLKAIHTTEPCEAAVAKALVVADEFERMRQGEAVRVVRDGHKETQTYIGFPREHWRRIRTNNPIEQLNREIRGRMRVIGTFPNGKTALMLVIARLRYVAESEWGSRCYLDVMLLDERPCRMAGLWDCRKVHNHFYDATCCHCLTLFWTEISLGLITNIIEAGAIVSATCLTWSAKTVNMEEPPWHRHWRLPMTKGLCLSGSTGKFSRSRILLSVQRNHAGGWELENAVQDDGQANQILMSVPLKSCCPNT